MDYSIYLPDFSRIDKNTLAAIYSVIAFFIIGGLLIGFIFLYKLIQKKKNKVEQRRSEQRNIPIIEDVIEKPRRRLQTLAIFLAYIVLFNGISSFISKLVVKTYLYEHNISLQELDLQAEYTLLTLQNIIIYLVVAVPIVLLSKKFLIEDFINLKKRPKYYLKYFFIGLGVMFGLNIFFNMITMLLTFGLSDGVVDSTNEQILVSIISNLGPNYFILGFTTIVLAPIVEELTFRKGIFGIVGKNCGLAIVISVLIFSSIHVTSALITMFPQLIAGKIEYYQFYLEAISLITYFGAAFSLAITYSLTKGNIYPSMLIHATNNLIAYIVTTISVIEL